MFTDAERDLMEQVESFAATVTVERGDETMRPTMPVVAAASRPPPPSSRAAAVSPQPPPRRHRDRTWSSSDESSAATSRHDEDAKVVAARLRRDLGILRKIAAIRAATTRVSGTAAPAPSSRHQAASRPREPRSLPRGRRPRSEDEDTEESVPWRGDRDPPPSRRGRGGERIGRQRPTSPRTDDDDILSDEEYGIVGGRGGRPHRGRRKRSPPPKPHERADIRRSSDSSTKLGGAVRVRSSCCRELALCINDIFCGVCDSCIDADAHSSDDRGGVGGSGGGRARVYTAEDYAESQPLTDMDMYGSSSEYASSDDDDRTSDRYKYQRRERRHRNSRTSERQRQDSRDDKPAHRRELPSRSRRSGRSKGRYGFASVAAVLGAAMLVTVVGLMLTTDFTTASALRINASLMTSMLGMPLSLSHTSVHVRKRKRRRRRPTSEAMNASTARVAGGMPSRGDTSEGESAIDRFSLCPQDGGGRAAAAAAGAAQPWEAQPLGTESSALIVVSASLVPSEALLRILAFVVNDGENSERSAALGEESIRGPASAEVAARRAQMQTASDSEALLVGVQCVFPDGSTTPVRTSINGVNASASSAASFDALREAAAASEHFNSGDPVRSSLLLTCDVPRSVIDAPRHGHTMGVRLVSGTESNVELHPIRLQLRLCGARVARYRTAVCTPPLAHECAWTARRHSKFTAGSEGIEGDIAATASICTKREDAVSWKYFVQSLRQWLEYHTALGAEHVFVYERVFADALFDPTQRLGHALSWYIDKGDVTVVPWQRPPLGDPLEVVSAFRDDEVLALNHCLMRTQGSVEWLVGLDVNAYVFAIRVVAAAPHGSVLFWLTSLPPHPPSLSLSLSLSIYVARRDAHSYLVLPDLMPSSAAAESSTDSTTESALQTLLATMPLNKVALSVPSHIMGVCPRSIAPVVCGSTVPGRKLLVRRGVPCVVAQCVCVCVCA